ncbi:DUF808 domain-containing protein [Persicimonas caeni]|uniref:DUF808 domain-containing protein n=1 Tax=Persicimonas caeni TaxID=2292766 RepID=A0A4Y6PYY6_PERCE|nr:DUF808 domain-containing protein [Persicimonas caeni]QDG53450.1 DUF808 domain-containing protein [Persicimonas caeni]QED34671.1 DUF808 domain-containing protein [Persicimonas caeni]
MAGTSLLALIDDIATLLDDVSVMTKVAAKKTAGLVGDDLAVNAEQVTGFAAEREWPVIWAVAKGATLNKIILIPAALLISAFLPWAIVPLLMLGGAFLCYEGFHKVHHKLFHHEEEKHEKEDLRKAFRDQKVDLVAFEEKKIKGAIRTDFILSAEIIVIALGAIAGPLSEKTYQFGGMSEATSELLVELGVLSVVGLGVVLVVYGLVAGIVKIDDLGLKLSKRGGGIGSFGDFLVDAAPKLMKGLGIVGTVAMFLVGGGIFSHNIEPIHHLFHDIAHATGPASGVVAILLDGVLGVIAGALILAVVVAGKKLYDSVLG